MREVNKLKGKGFDFWSHCKKRIGNGDDSRFWFDCWIGDVPLRVKFPRLFALDLNKEASVAVKLSAPIDVSFRRNARGGLEEHFDGNFRVKEIRNYIDDLFLPHQAAPTRWIKYIPIKVNIFAWRARQDCLSTRVNLIRRGITIESSYVRWWGLDPHGWSSFQEWQSWILSIRISSNVKDMLEGVFGLFCGSRFAGGTRSHIRPGYFGVIIRIKGFRRVSFSLDMISLIFLAFTFKVFVNSIKLLAITVYPRPCTRKHILGTSTLKCSFVVAYFVDVGDFGIGGYCWYYEEEIEFYDDGVDEFEEDGCCRLPGLLDMILPHILSVLPLHLEVPVVVINGVLGVIHRNMIRMKVGLSQGDLIGIESVQNRHLVMEETTNIMIIKEADKKVQGELLA
nr:RNA-directed DNA polymerase, eukaryota, reverse transcriptase zinc-binding domain protein [Tanacetum cinerariifolium]